MASRWPAFAQLMRLHNPVGSLLLLWPTLAALFMAAQGLPAWHLIVIFALGTVVMRSAGCVINDYADRHVDGHVRRTSDRPLVTGAVQPREALYLFAGLTTSAGLLALFLNTTTLLLAVAGLGVAALYPFMKRWTHMPQVVLGAAFSWGILMAWTAVQGELPREAGLMFFGSLVWIVGYDTLYAMADREDDLVAGVKSTAILFGTLDRFMVGVLQVLALLAFLLLGQGLEYGVGFSVALLAVAALFGYQQYLVRKRRPEACLAAFKNNQWVGFALFAGVLIETLVLPALAT